jgi:hypothetical protein
MGASSRCRAPELRLVPCDGRAQDAMIALLMSVHGPGEGRRVVLRSAFRRVLPRLDSMHEGKAQAFPLPNAYGYDLRGIAPIAGVSVATAQTKPGRREIHERIAADPDLADALVSSEAEL